MSVPPCACQNKLFENCMAGIIEDPPQAVPSQHRSLFYSTQLKYVELADALKTQGNRLSEPELKVFTHQILNLFCMTQRIYQSLDANYLFRMVKNLCLGYNSIVVLLIEKIHKLNQKIVCIQKRESTEPGTLGSEDPSSGPNEEDLPFKELRVNKLGGIHLYNENHFRGLEDQRILEQLKVEKEQRIRKKRQQLMETIIYQELNHKSEVEHAETTDELTKYILETKKQGSIYNYTPYEGQLQEILAFFSNAQNEANDFLVRKAKADPKTTQTNFSFADFQREVQVQNAQVKRKILQKLKTFISSFREKQKQLENYFSQKQCLLVELAEIKSRKRTECSVQTEYNIDQLERVAQNERRELELTHLALQHLKDSENESMYRENKLKYEISGQIKDLQRLHQQKKQLEDVVASLKKAIKVEKSKKSIPLKEELSSRTIKTSGNGKSDHFLKIEEDRDLSSNSRQRKRHEDTNDEVSLTSTKRMAKTLANNDWKSIEKDVVFSSSKEMEGEGDKSGMMYRTHQEKKKVVRYHIEPKPHHRVESHVPGFMEEEDKEQKLPIQSTMKDKKDQTEMEKKKTVEQTVKTRKNKTTDQTPLPNESISSQQQQPPSFTPIRPTNQEEKTGEPRGKTKLLKTKKSDHKPNSKNKSSGSETTVHQKQEAVLKKGKPNESHYQKMTEQRDKTNDSISKEANKCTNPSQKELQNPNLLLNQREESGNHPVFNLEVVKEEGQEERQYPPTKLQNQPRMSIPSSSSEKEEELRERISLDLKQRKQSKNQLSLQLYHVEIHPTPTPSNSAIQSRRTSLEPPQCQQQEQRKEGTSSNHLSGFRDKANIGSPNNRLQIDRRAHQKIGKDPVKQEKCQALNNSISETLKDKENQIETLSQSISPSHSKQLTTKFSKKREKKAPSPSHRHSLSIPQRNSLQLLSAHKVVPQPKESQDLKIEQILAFLPLSDGPADSAENILLNSLKSKLRGSYQSSKLTINEIKNIIKVISLTSRKPTEEEQSFQLAPILSSNRFSLPSIKAKIDPIGCQKKKQHGRYSSYCDLSEYPENSVPKDESDIEDILQLSSLKTKFQSKFREAHRGCKQGAICTHILKYVETVMKQIQLQRHRQKPSMTLHIQNIGRPIDEDAQILTRIGNSTDVAKQSVSGRVKTETAYVRKSLQKVKVGKMMGLPSIREQG